MAFKSASLTLVAPRVGSGEGGNAATPPEGDSSALFIYRSPDAIATVIAGGYITNGPDYGLQVNDTVIVIDDATPTIDLCIVSAIAANGDVTLVNGT